VTGALTCRWLTVIAVVPLLVLSAGCGGRHRPPPSLSKQAVMRVFRAASGIEPNVAVSSARLGYVLDGDFAAPAELRTYQKLFGGFSVYVAGPAGSGMISRMLSGASPDGDGLRWRRMSSQGTAVWMAIKRYGTNVALSWIAPSAARVVDGRWNRLDQILRAVAARANALRPHGP
jgi:hypothetical protein